MDHQLFDLFGDGDFVPTRFRGVLHRPFNDENQAKIGLTGPIKPYELPRKEIKKSFMSNTGLALPSTPAQNTFTASLPTIYQKTLSPDIYHDVEGKQMLVKLEFSYPVDTNKIFNTDCIDFLFAQRFSCEHDVDPPGTPKFNTLERLPEFDASYEDDFFTDDLDISVPFQDDDLPDLINELAIIS